jgi:hypothetical protein
MSVSDLFLVVNIAGITKNAMPAAPAEERDLSDIPQENAISGAPRH